LTERIQQYVGPEANCILVANCTLGLMIALRASIGKRIADRNEVILPSFTFAATANAVHWAGLSPVFVDVNPAHWHLDVAALEQALYERGSRVAAILACSTFGCPPPPSVRSAWEELGQANAVPVIVDSASGFGAVDSEGHRLGLQGSAEVFSFHATKPFAIGEGGAVITRDGELARDIARLANFGFDASREVGRPDLVGLNAKLSELHAATGLAMLDHYESVLRVRRERAAEIRAPLESAGFVFQDEAERSTWQFVPTLAKDSATRDDVLRRAAELGVEVRQYFTPLHRFGAFFHECSAGDLAVTEDLASRILSLPLWNQITDAEVERIVACVRVVVAARR
jgi:dTDP-4-amino-4,6-dideoxygalactose transaminase